MLTKLLLFYMPTVYLDLLAHLWKILLSMNSIRTDFFSNTTLQKTAEVHLFKISPDQLNTRFFCKQHFYKQPQAEIGKKSSKY